MPLLVTGTIGLDILETPSAKVENVIGGSAAHFSFAASVLAPVRLVAVVGDDFPEEFQSLFTGRSIDVLGLEIRKGSKTFRWHGKYFEDMNLRESIRTDLNVIAEAPPIIPDSFRDSEFIFLANTHPAIQRGFVEQLTKPKLVVCDTMDLWIGEFRDELVKTLAVVDGIVLNDSEAKMLTGSTNMILAARDILKMGPRFVVVKKGEHGAMLVTNDTVFVLPAYPSTKVVDPTGAGDSFGGGMMAWLASQKRTDTEALKAGLAHGTIIASFIIEDFSLNALKKIDKAAVEKRLAEFKAMMAFE